MNNIKKKIVTKKFLIFFIISILISFSKTQEIIFKTDLLCEQFGSSLISHIFQNNTNSKNSINQSNNLNEKFENMTFKDIIKHSGTGLNDLGDYFGCKRNKVSEYYMMNIISGQNSLVQTTLGFCYYKNCTKDYFQNFTNKLSNTIYNNTLLNTNNTLIINFINPDEEIEITKKYYGIAPKVTIILIIIIIAFEIIITILNPKKKILKAFNFISNAKSILTVKNQNKLYEHLRVFDGLRFFSAFYVVYGHTCVYPLAYGAKNAIELVYASKKWYFAFVTSAYYAVDIFFYMSGFFFVFSIQKYLNKKINKIKILLMGFSLRFIRLLPFMLIAIFGFTFLLPYLSYGPKYSVVDSFNKTCTKYYWHNLLFINNFIIYSTNPNETSCFGHGWYLACDMQFFIYSMLVMIIFNNKPHVRKYIFIITFILCSFIQIFIVYKYNFSYNDMIHTSDQVTNLDQLQLFYIRPYVRITPYLIGILFGEFFLETKLYKTYNSKEKKEKEKISEKEDLDINIINNNNLKKKDIKFTLLNSSIINSFLPNEIKNYKKENTNESMMNEIQNSNISSFNIEMNEEEIFENSNNIYFKTNSFLEKNDWVCYIITILSFILFNLVLLNSNISNRGEKELSTFYAAMFQTFGKVFFVLPIGIIIHLTFLGKLNILRKFLSLKFETQISRNSFGIYVVHLYFLGIFIFSYSNNYYIRFLDIVILSIGIYFFSWIFSFIVGLIFESPIVALCKGFK